MTETIAFSPESMAQVEKIIRRYPAEHKKSALIPVLHIAQKEFGGWLQVPVMDYVASVLEIQPIEVYEVATFYTMFNMKPVGKYVLEVCRTGPCMVNGSDGILEHLCTTLGINIGETTADGMFTIKAVECLGACGYAPMLQLGKFYHEFLTNEKVDDILRLCREGSIAID
ncbi:NAD(P)H-dependent oxidoreductase subunit E [Chryseobacterium salipaludis]|uniref:NADH-quinone oxidoreductase subunit NuoE family protein n=1 Tax=Chryseobacterium TaxID=59732 RepID=UPI001FF5B88C|nr:MULTISPECIES: NAD(P)H-dependent oxidoreductase subunit E [Chryseobacterium]MCJ8496869.1 NAD(P)H-dependent oxidoreductase subunit E [Chryseobacterium salipaludis]MCX3296350.1 NAD(P)H-dependent oxidoreductase subunit E [Planobacterium sp. JC490]